MSISTLLFALAIVAFVVQGLRPRSNLLGVGWGLAISGWITLIATMAVTW